MCLPLMFMLTVRPKAFTSDYSLTAVASGGLSFHAGNGILRHKEYAGP